MKNRIFIKARHFFKLLTLSAAVAFFPFSSSAQNENSYASSSALSSGNWAKIKVEKSGMQFVSNAQLTQMGFQDPSKVNAYGFGGRMISEVLDKSHPDDLPKLPTIHTSTGIIFFGVDNIKWTANSTTVYSHTMHPYSDASYYFLSDSQETENSMETLDLTDILELQPATTFLERILHEEELMAPMNSGRLLLGEDLRSGQQKFNFPLTDNASNDANIVVAVGSNTSGAAGTFRFTSNGRVDRNSMNLDAVKSSDQFLRTGTTKLYVDECGNNLEFGISFSSSGVINLARLDYLEIVYERELSMPADQLYFYFNESEEVAAFISGITGETEIWDVTEAHEPKKVEFSKSGNRAAFRVESGYHEFIAFNRSKITTPVESMGKVANQDLHSLPVPDMLIISPQEFKPAAEKLAALHREMDDMTVHIATPEELYNEFSSGTPDVSAFRKALKMWYDRGLEEAGLEGDSKVKYCLIFSRPTYDNKMVTHPVKSAGYPRVPIWQSATGLTENTSYSTDDFIGMLDDTRGSNNMGTQKIRVAVGRFPVRTLEEAETAVTKLSNYLKEPEQSSWRNNVMIIADDQDNGQHLDQAEMMYANMKAGLKSKNYQYERLYLDNYSLKMTSVGMEYPDAKKRLLSKFEEGQVLIGYIGHANTVSWTHEHLLNWGDINSFNNTRLPVLYAATCEFARWDDNEQSGAEVMWAFPKTGIIASICPSRSVFISQNGPLSAQFGLYALELNSDGKPTTLGDVFMKTKNGITNNDDNKLRYTLIGDPAMRMPVPRYQVVTTAIDSVEISESNLDYPVIEARATPIIKGEITDIEGNKVTDFNGHVYLKLYDAEKVIETLGNGNEGKVMFYNDRKTKLFDGVTKVTEGEWEIKVYMPSEIENNFTPGRVTFYAISDDGREANGATENFYVYGYDENATEDHQGPEITRFVLNHDGFVNGAVTHDKPVVYANFVDESGINISDAGIGHSLLLTLDNKTIYSDVTDFYAPDPDDSRAGSFIYQLPKLEPGKHELTLSVWDCANNSSYSTIAFNVAVIKDADIYDIKTIYTSDRTGIDFIISSDMPLTDMQCKMEVFDLTGLRVWSSTQDDRTGADCSLKMRWDFKGSSGQRVSKGIYVCRATVVTPEGRETTKSKKIVVSAQ